MNKRVMLLVLVFWQLVLSQSNYRFYEIPGGDIAAIFRLNGSFYVIPTSGNIYTLSMNVFDNWQKTDLMIRNVVEDVHVNPENNGFILGTPSGIFWYNSVSDTLISIPPPPSLNGKITAVLKFDVNTILVGTEKNGIWFTQNMGSTWNAANYAFNQFQTVYDLVKLGSDTVLACTGNGILYSTNLADWAETGLFSGSQVFHLHTNSQGHAIVMTSQGPMTCDIKNFNTANQVMLTGLIGFTLRRGFITEDDTIFAVGYPGKVLTGFFADHELHLLDDNQPVIHTATFITIDTIGGQPYLLMGDEDKGVTTYNLLTKTWHVSSKIRSQTIFCASLIPGNGNTDTLLAVSRHMLWKVPLDNPSYWHVMDGLFLDIPTALSCASLASPDTLLVGTKGNGLYYVNLRLKEKQLIQADLIVTDILNVPNGWNVISTLGNGILRWRCGDATTVPVTTGVPSTESIFALNWIPTESPVIAAGAMNGNVYFSTDMGFNWTADDIGVSNPEANVTAIHGTVDGRILAGTAGVGLFLKENQTWMHVPGSEQMGTVSSVALNILGQGLIGTFEGIFKLDLSSRLLSALDFPEPVFVQNGKVLPNGDLVLGLKGKGVIYLPEYQFPPLYPPVNLTGIVKRDSIVLNWKPVTLNNFHHYQIYWRVGPSGNFSYLEKTADFDSRDTTFVVYPVSAGNTYYFYITTVLQTNEESVPSDTIEIFVPQPEIPATRIEETIPLRDGGVIIWNTVQVSDFREYRIYWGPGPDNLTMHTTVLSREDTVYYINSLTNGTTYYLAVSVFTDQGEGPLSPVVSMVPGIPLRIMDLIQSDVDSLFVRGEINLLNQLVRNLRLVISTTQNFSDPVQVIPIADSLTGVDPIWIARNFYQPLEPGTFYYGAFEADYIIRSIGFRQESDWVRILTPPPALILHYPSDGSTSINPIVIFRWDSIPDAVYELQVATTDFSVDPGNVMVMKDSIVNSHFKVYLDPGTEYYWRVRAKNKAGEGPWSAPYHFTTFQFTSTGIDHSWFYPTKNIGEYTPNDYQLVGVPGDEIPLGLGNFVNGRMGEDWRVLRDNGADRDYLEEYDFQSSLFYLGRGRAFWMIARESVNVKINDVPLPEILRQDSVYYVQIPLHPGWNIIANPLESPVRWEEIRKLNQLPVTSQIFEFSSMTGNYLIANECNPYRGYYFDNVLNLANLRIPVWFGGLVKKSSAGYRLDRTREKAWKPKWSITIFAERTPPLQMGVDDGASNGLDVMDQRMPLGLNVENWMALVPDIGQITDRRTMLQTDLRSPGLNYYCWEIVSEGTSHSSQILRFELDDVPIYYHVYCLNLETGQSFDLRQQNQIELTYYKEEVHLRIIVGEREEVEEIISRFVPREFRLQQNFPNPFNPTTTIAAEIPEESDITLEVYNIIGVRVRTLFRGRVSAGIHYYQWDGRDENGNELSAGIYFYRLKTPTGKNLTGKMVFMK